MPRLSGSLADDRAATKLPQAPNATLVATWCEQTAANAPKTAAKKGGAIIHDTAWECRAIKRHLEDAGYDLVTRSEPGQDYLSVYARAATEVK